MPSWTFHICRFRSLSWRVSPLTASQILPESGWPISLTGLAEAVRFSDYGGERDVDRDYFTVGLQLGWESLHGAVFGTSRRTDGDSDDQILQISAGHEFDTGMALNLGWKTLDEGGENTNSFGIFLTYGLKF